MATWQEHMAEADKLEDQEEMIYSGERLLNRKVYEAASNYLWAVGDAEFARMNGGVEAMRAELQQAVNALEMWFRDAEIDSY